MAKDKTTGSLPHFIIAGAAKSGTTSLANYLARHPDVFMPPHEMNYFAFADGCYNFRVLNNQLITSLQTYRSFYQDTCKRIPGEKSVSYLYTYWVDKVIKNIKTIHPLKDRVKIIILLRQPVDRMYSQYLFNRHSHETLSFDSAIKAWEERKESGWVPAYDYIGASYYAYPVQQYLKHFHHVKVLLFDDLKNNPTAFFQEVATFLGIDGNTIPDITGEVFNRGGVPKNRLYKIIYQAIRNKKVKKLTNTLITGKMIQQYAESLKKVTLKKEHLRQDKKKEYNTLFRDDITMLEQLIHRNLSSWK